MTRRIAIATALVIFVLVAGWYMGFYRPESGHIKALQSKQQEAQANLAQLDARYSQLVRSQRQLPAERADLARLERLVPNGPELDRLVTGLYAAAATAGVQLTSISSPAPAGYGPGSGSAGPAPAQLQLTLQVSGTPGEIEDLVRVLGSAPRLFVVDSFGLALAPVAAGPRAGAGSSQTGTSISLRAFYALPNADSPAS